MHQLSTMFQRSSPKGHGSKFPQFTFGSAFLGDIVKGKGML